MSTEGFREDCFNGNRLSEIMSPASVSTIPHTDCQVITSCRKIKDVITVITGTA